MNSRGERLPLLIHRNSSVNDLERQQPPEDDTPSTNLSNIRFTRQRGNSIVSVVTTIKDFVMDNYPSKSTLKFLASIVFAIFAFFVFNLIFLPRTSLGRDYRSVHFSTLSKVETERLFLRHISEENKIQEYLNAYKTTDSLEFTYNKLKEFGLDPYVNKYQYHSENPKEGHHPITKELRNVIYEIPGLLDEIIIIGNHRGNPGSHNINDGYSGGAILLEVSRAFSELIKVGWRPLRTIRVISWDGEDEGKPASILYGEENKKALPKNVLAYLSLENHVAGDHLKVGSNPLLNFVLLEVAKVIPFNEKEETLYEHWNLQNGRKIDLIAGGFSDITMFQHHLGIPSCSISFVHNSTAILPDTHFEDHDSQLHNTLAKYFGFLGLYLSEKEVSEYKVSNSARMISKFISRYIEEIPADWLADKKFYQSIKSLRETIDDFKISSINFDQIASGLQDQISFDYPWFQFYKKLNLAMKIKQVSSRARDLDGVFIYDAGLDNRTWFKHILLAPMQKDENVCEFLPGLYDSIINKEKERFLYWVGILQQRINVAIGKLDIKL